MDKTNLNTFFSPKSIAVVGASPKKESLGNVLIENIKKGGWRGKIYPVNPKYSKNRRDYFANLDEIKKPVDLVLIAIPAPLVATVLEKGAKAKPTIKNFAVISSGFKEIGYEGKKLEENLASIAERYKLNILGPNCLGFANPYDNLNATFTDVHSVKSPNRVGSLASPAFNRMKLQTGHTAIVSQSGALAVALLDWAAEKNIGFSKIISIGNKTILDESVILEFLAGDLNTRAIALYLEDIKAGENFMRAAAKITPKKPVIILKAGKTAVGQKAVSSHTGSLAQDEAIVEAVFEKLNIIPADNIEEFQSIIYYLNSSSIPEKNGIIVLTNAGGPGVMASDFIGKSKNIKLLNIPDNFKKELGKDLPASASVENPIDVIGDAPPERYQKTIEKIAKKFPGNPLVVILTPQNQTDPKKVAMILAKYKNKISDISACFMGGEKIKSAKVVLRKNNIPNFHRPEKALMVIEKMVKYFESRHRRNAPTERLSNIQKTSQRGVSTAKSLMRQAILENRKMLFWNEAEKLFGKYGVKLAKSISFKDFKGLANKKIPYPCVLKTDDPDIAHRLEKNAVALNVQNEKELRSAFAKMKRTTGAKNFLIQPMVEPGLELILGMKHDPSFGPVILCGWGGSFTEIFKDKTVLIPPLSQNEIKDKLSQLAIFPILKGFRGKRGFNLKEISKIAVAIEQMSADITDIGEIDINPLVVYNNGKLGQVLDAKIFLK